MPSSAPTPTAEGNIRRLRFDVSARPFLVLLELTRACDLACRHCRAEAIPEREADELTTSEVAAVLDDLAALGPPRPRLVLTGGDPLRRPDLDQLVWHASGAGLSVAVSPAGTPRATPDRLGALRAAGAGAVSFSLDAASAPAHDAFRRVDGSFHWTLAGCEAAHAAGLRLQVNSTVTAATINELPALARLVSELHVGMWSVFFVVPVGRAGADQALSAAQTEDVLRFLQAVADWVPLKTTEAPAFRRVVSQPATSRPGPLYRALTRRLDEVWPVAARPSVRRRAPLAVGDGRGVVFVSRRGDVQPSGFLPLVAGNVREAPLTTIYATAPLLRALRDGAARDGRCGRCEYTDTCGGSRAQAFARTGDPLAADPSCPYEPGAGGSPLHAAAALR